MHLRCWHKSTRGLVEPSNQARICDTFAYTLCANAVYSLAAAVRLGKTAQTISGIQTEHSKISIPARDGDGVRGG